MLKKLRKNNKASGDLQLGIVMFLLIFVVSVSLIYDFWFVSSAKSIIIKEVQGAELYRLVTSLSNGTEDKNILTDPTHADMTPYQEEALSGYDQELNHRLENMIYLKDYDVLSVKGLDTPIGKMGIITTMNYKVKTMVKSPRQIFSVLSKNDTKFTANKDVKLTVQTNMVPYVFDNSGGVGHYDS